VLDPVTERRFSSWRRALVALKSELAEIKAGLEAKANFDPNQPRDENGRWTREGGDVERPKQPRRPAPEPDPNFWQRILAQGYANYIRLRFFLDLTGRVLDDRVNADLYIEAGKPAQSLDVLRNDVATPRPGTEVHHIIERSAWDRAEFEPARDRDGWLNTVRISTLRHRQITSWYARANEDYGNMSPRAWLRGRDYQDHLETGLKALIEHGVLQP
jgi:hypothetical protein